ncbi:DUF6492 family protein [Naumannella halotolerans]|uniref:DUF6492 family protein n=1 Tax=Naumannella halotolerans TaxID=993414 RepID=UPI00370D782B
MRFDVVSICFRDELPLLALQSRSIDVFWDLDMIGNYMIIINDPESADECRDYITRRILPSMSDRLRAVTRVVTADDLIGQVMPGRGWKTQQALKLAVARAVESPFYLALDAKNHFVKPVSGEDFFDADLTPYAAQRVYKEDESQRYWLNASYRLLGLTPPVTGDLRAGVTVTPYMFQRRHVLDLLDHPSRVLDHLGRGKSKATEFFVYFAFLEAERQGYFSWYSPKASRQATLFRKSPQSPRGVAKVIESVDSGQATSFAVHRDRLPRLSESSYAAIHDLWSSRGLLRDEFLREDLRSMRTATQHS